MENKTTIELQEELTSLIQKKNNIPNLVNIDWLIERKRDEIQELLKINISDSK